MRLHGVACAMRDFKRSLRPDATNPVIIVVPDRLAAYRLKDPRSEEIHKTRGFRSLLIAKLKNVAQAEMRAPPMMVCWLLNIYQGQRMARPLQW